MKYSFGIVWGDPFRVTIREGGYPENVYRITNPGDTGMGEAVLIEYDPTSSKRECRVIPKEVIEKTMNFINEIRGMYR